VRILLTGATGTSAPSSPRRSPGAAIRSWGVARSPGAASELAGRGYEVRGDLRDRGPPPGRLLDEHSPPDPVDTFAWRPALEAKVIAAGATAVRTVVIRPGMVYGRGGGPLNQFADMAAGGIPRYVGAGTNHWTLVHVDDLAELCALALERAPAGTLVNGVVGPPQRVRDLAEAATAGAGFEAPPTPWPAAEAATELGEVAAEAVTRDHRICGERARMLLGWEPPPRSPLDEPRRQADAGSGISSHLMPDTPSQ